MRKKKPSPALPEATPAQPERDSGEPKRVPQFGDTVRVASNRADGKFPASVFKLPGHLILPVDWISEFKPEDVIWTRGKCALVRNGKKKRIETKPPEGDDEACAWTEEHYREEVHRFLTIDRDLKARLIARARRGKPGARALAAKATDLIDELFRLASNGNQTAASQLAELLRKSVIQLTELAKEKPELVRPIARKSWKWPVMKSRHPLLSDEHEDFLGCLNLGYDLPFHFDQSSHWRLDEFARIALALLMYLWGARKEQRGNFDYLSIGELADALPEFRKGPNAEKWWELAEAGLLHTYPKPNEIPELADLVRLKQGTPESKVREKIMERIKQRFINFAKP